ncbi:MAG TPA: 3-dehydroquinate synthase family protein, partial [Acidimicrobiales bacterium]|nr:3-dehydroquinate synthase family protein [Acidimicrobiales bacterium]
MITVDHVTVGAGARACLPSVLPAGVRRVAVVTQDGLPAVEVPRPHEVVCIGDGEAHKTIATVEDLCRRFTRFGLTRADAVVAVGGGMVTDVAGFAAATYHRGIAVVHLPTTLLGMVDAAIGGKTGVNLPEGKNLVGAFWPPAAVLCDTDLLATLPEREWRCGHGEMAKYHFLTGDDLLTLPLDERIGRCVAIKVAVVAADPYERTGQRATLNYGHTLAHALEIAVDFDLRHGEAVAIGLVFAAELACVLGRVGPGRVTDHREVVAAYGLSDRLPPGADEHELLSFMARD